MDTIRVVVNAAWIVVFVGCMYVYIPAFFKLLFMPRRAFVLRGERGDSPAFVMRSLAHRERRAALWRSIWLSGLGATLSFVSMLCFDYALRTG